MSKASSVLNTFLATLGTICVVLGLIVLVKRGTLVADTASDLAAVSLAVASSTQRVLIVDPQGARLADGRGDRELKWPEDADVLSQVQIPLIGYDLTTSETAYLGDGFKILESLGLRSPDGSRTILPTMPREDGAGAVTVRDGAGERTLVLRLPSGEGVTGASLIGWWNEAFVAIAGAASSSRALFAVGLTGEVRRVATLPAAAEGLRARNGEVWYVTALPGEGLESALQPPSEVHRVTLAGQDTVVARDESRVIGRYALNDEQLAYQTDDGKVTFMNQGPALAGSGFPIAIADERIYERRGAELWTFDIKTGEEKKLTIIKDGRAAMFILGAE